jgi:hypothetical protein
MRPSSRLLLAGLAAAAPWLAVVGTTGMRDKR